MLHDETRKLLIEAWNKTHNAKEIAECFSVNTSTVYRVMDNMRSHHAKAVKQLLDSSKVTYLYLPPYSPDLNPIEKMWSKLKAFLRKEKIRMASELPSAISKGFLTIRPTDCIGWFHSCNYVQ